MSNNNNSTLFNKIFGSIDRSKNLNSDLFSVESNDSEYNDLDRINQQARTNYEITVLHYSDHKTKETLTVSLYSLTNKLINKQYAFPEYSETTKHVRCT